MRTEPRCLRDRRKRCGKVVGNGVRCADCPAQMADEPDAEETEIAASPNDAWLSRLDLARLYEDARPRLTVAERKLYRAILAGKVEPNPTEPLHASLLAKLRADNAETTPQNVIPLRKRRTKRKARVRATTVQRTRTRKNCEPRQSPADAGRVDPNRQHADFGVRDG